MSHKAKIYTREELRRAVFGYFVHGSPRATVGTMTNAMADYIYDHYGEETEVEE